MSERLLASTVALWLALLALSIALATLASIHDTLPGDTGTASWLQGLPFPGESLADTVRSITSTEVVLAGGGALALLLWLRGYRLEALVFAAALIVLPLLQAGIKEIVDRPRPTADLVELRGTFSSPSFPSGHVMSATYFYGFLLYLALSLPLTSLARAALAAVAAAVLALTAPANIWLGVHWPSDALGGYAWGALLLLPVVAACLRFRRRA
ncbi:MAG: phosphatase PAP2 family protein [Dehalococcoidia bacterium]